MIVSAQRDPRVVRRGAAVVELAVLLPLLMFLFLITLDFGRIFYYAVTLDNCALNGVTFASQMANTSVWQGAAGSVTSAQQAAIEDGAGLNPPLKTSDVTVTNGTDKDGNPTVTVSVSYLYKTIAAVPYIPNSVQLTRSATMRVAP